MSMKKMFVKAAFALVLAAPFAANAMPISLTAGQSALFNFDLASSASGFILSAQIDTGLSNFNLFQGDWGTATCYEGLGGSGQAHSCGLGGDTFYDSGFTDGLFSMSINALSGSFSVNPFASGAQLNLSPYFPWIIITAIPDVPGSSGATAVSEPGTFAMFGLALAALALTWRRRMTR